VAATRCRILAGEVARAPDFSVYLKRSGGLKTGLYVRNTNMVILGAGGF
jgi:hypothetical protein